jgi:undecaprenyl-diphosphatase
VLVVPALLLGVAFMAVVRRRPDAESAAEHGRLVTPAWVMVVGGAVVVGGLALLVTASSGVPGIDSSVAPWGRQHTTQLAQSALDFVTSFGATPLIVVTALVVLIGEMIRRPSRWLPVFLIAVVVGQILLSSEIKHLVDRARPTVNPIARTLDPSFPSGHTTAAAACFAAYAVVLARGRSRQTQAVLAGGAVFAACAVAASRVLLGVHWLTDVVGGLALGWAWCALCFVAFGHRLLQPSPTDDSLHVRPPAT